MRVLLQRVLSARVDVGQETVAAIDRGLLLLVGVGRGDTEAAAQSLARKIVALRIFSDENGKMNRSLADTSGKILSVSQFTLYGDLERGNRPGFEGAEKPEPAKALWSYFNDCLRAAGGAVEEGVFGADMRVSLVNDGPVTFWLEAKKDAS